MELTPLALPMIGLWSIFVWIAFGFVVALIAKAIMPGKDPGGFFVTVLIGIGGAVLGGVIADFLPFGGDGGKASFFDLSNWIFSIGGALIILYVWKKFLAPMLNKK